MDLLLLAPDIQIVRRYKGDDHEVRVFAGGFEFGGGTPPQNGLAICQTRVSRDHLSP